MATKTDYLLIGVGALIAVLLSSYVPAIVSSGSAVRLSSTDFNNNKINK